MAPPSRINDRVAVGGVKLSPGNHTAPRRMSPKTILGLAGLFLGLTWIASNSLFMARDPRGWLKARKWWVVHGSLYQGREGTPERLREIRLGGLVFCAAVVLFLVVIVASIISELDHAGRS